MKRVQVVSFALALVIAQTEPSSSTAQKTSEVIWTDETRTKVLFVPGTLLRSLGTWEGDEIPDLSGVGLRDHEAEALKLNVQWARGSGRISTQDLIAGRCPDDSGSGGPQLAPDGTTSSRPLSEWVRLLRGRAYVARIESMEAGWAPAGSSVGTLVGFRINSWIAGEGAGEPLQVVSFLKGFGWLHLGSATLCRGATSVLSKASLGDLFFIWDTGGERIGPLSGARMILPMTADTIDTASCNFCGGERSASLESIRRAMGRP